MIVCYVMCYIKINKNNINNDKLNSMLFGLM